MTTPGRVLVAMSGGVDSSVAAALLQSQGYECVAATMRLGESTEPLEAAEAVAKALGMDWHEIDLRPEFAAKVVDAFAHEYLVGRTPNPCVVCNKEIKFGLFAEKTAHLGYDFLATGHYARIFHEPLSARWCLAKGLDGNKDQSYYLYGLSQEQLSRVLLPLGGYTKAQVRALATKMKLPTAQRSESQDICFLADGDYRAFLRRFWPASLRPGPILTSEGKQLGQHEGLAFYTLGQRRGIGVNAREPLYVKALDQQRNAVIVGTMAELFSESLIAAEVNWVSWAPIKEAAAVEARIRYRAGSAAAFIHRQAQGGVLTTFAAPQRAVTPGQSVVWYKDELVVGGGIITAQGAPE